MSRFIKKTGATFILFILGSIPALASDETLLWKAISERPNLVLVMRHAEITGRNPTQFDATGKCQGESMLTRKGQEDARTIGKKFIAQGISPDQINVVSSAMCRTRDTAMLAFGKAELDPALREFFSGSADQMNEAMDAAENWIKRLRGSTPLVLVTHLPNIDALTSEQPNYNQLVVTESDKEGQLKVLGLIRLY